MVFPKIKAPEPRFACEDELVRDRLTGLVWVRNANLAEYLLTWQEALALVADMNGARALDPPTGGCPSVASCAAC